MKKLRVLVLGLLVVLCCAIFTACGVKEPTKDDIIEALEDENIVDKDIDYELDVKDTTLNDDKDKATVECAVIIKEGSVQITNEYELKFKLRDDKKSWKLRECEKSGDTTYKLVDGVDDKVVSEKVSNVSFHKDGVTLSMGGTASSFEIKEHKKDDQELKDTVTLKCIGVSGHITYEMMVDVVFRYYTNSKSWSYVESSVESVKEIGYEDGYEFKKEAADILNELVANNKYVYLMGKKYSFNSEGVSLSNGKVGEIKYNNNYCTANVSFDIKYADLTATITSEISYKYADKAWSYYSMNNSKCDKIAFSATGTWAGNDTANTIALEILTTSDNKSGYADAKVSYTLADGVTYSYKAYVYSYDPSSQTMQISPFEFEKSSDNATHSMTTFNGKFDESGAFVPRSTSYKWSFAKQSSSEKPAENASSEAETKTN